MSGARILVVDDEGFVRESLQALLAARGFDVLVCSGGEEAAARLRDETIDVVLTDMKMPAGDGNALLRAASAEGIDVPILVLTGASTISDAVEAMKAGAYDLLEKPVDPERLVRALERALERSRLSREVVGLRATLRLSKSGRRWVARSAAAQRVRDAVAKVARADAPVLLTGPSGVGKSVVAEELHRSSARAHQPFVRVDCAALSADVAPLVLFGTSKGGAPGVHGERLGRVSLARGGTLLLDEISALSLEAQGRLLGLLESGEYERLGEERARHADVRVIATTNQLLQERVERGSFREDLLWRLDVLRIDVPILELRREDLAELVPELLNELGRELGVGDGHGSDTASSLRLAPHALALLEAYSWPGNVRELRSTLERALLLHADCSGGATLDADVISRALDSQLGATQAAADADSDLRLRQSLLALERRLVLAAIARAHGRRAEAADLLGVDARNLGYYFRKHKIGDDELERAARG